MDEERDENDRVSLVLKRLFGKPLRILLGCWINRLNGETFILKDAQEAMEDLGQPRSGVPIELRVFTSLGMLDELKVGNRVYFTNRDSNLWAVFASIDAALGLGNLDTPRATSNPTPEVGRNGPGPEKGR